MNPSFVDSPELNEVHIDNEKFYRISHVDRMRPFFMSIVSDANHWMFIGSNGGLSAGRKNAEYALFPYYTDDKLIESAENTGSKSIFLVENAGQTEVWEPFSFRYASNFRLSRNLYKNVYGNKIVFEEVNHDLELSFRYQWNSSNIFGFVRKCSLENLGKANKKISMLDGLQNIMPSGVGSGLRNQSSNLVDAYKRSELEKSSGIGIFGLSAIIVDKAEPREALKANFVWSLGLDDGILLLGSLQLERLRNLLPMKEEVDIKGERAAYFVSREITLGEKETKSWMIIADVNKSSTNLASLIDTVKNDRQLESRINEDIELGTKNLVALIAAADALQLTSDPLHDTRHISNTLFNIMRGGIFDDNYQIEKKDFEKYLANANREVAKFSKVKIDQLPDVFSL